MNKERFFKTIRNCTFAGAGLGVVGSGIMVEVRIRTYNPNLVLINALLGSPNSMDQLLIVGPLVVGTMAGFTFGIAKALLDSCLEGLHQEHDITNQLKAN